MPQAEETTIVERKLVTRKIEHRSGAGNLIVIKRGEELLENLKPRLADMKKDSEKVEFDAKKTMQDVTNPRVIPYSDSKEFIQYAEMMGEWELKEGVKNYYEYKAKMRRLQVLIDHFKPGHDYELTVDELVEILS